MTEMSPEQAQAIEAAWEKAELDRDGAAQTQRKHMDMLYGLKRSCYNIYRPDGEENPYFCPVQIDPWDYFETDMSSAMLAKINRREIRRIDLKQLWKEKLDKIWPDHDHERNDTSACFSPNGRYIACASWDKMVYITCVNSNTTRAIKGHTQPVLCVCFSPNGEEIASGSNDCTVRITHLESDSARVIKGHTQPVSSVCFSPDSEYIASGSGDKTVRITRIDTGATVRVIQGHTDIVNSVCFSPDGKCIASGSDDETVRITSVDTGETVHVLKNGRYFELVYGSDGWLCFYGLRSVQQKLSELGITEQRQMRGLTKDMINEMELEPAMVRKLEEAKEKYSEHESGRIVSVCFSPDGRYIVSANMDWGMVHIRRVDTGATVRVFISEENSDQSLRDAHSTFHFGYVNAVCFSPDGEYIASASNDCTVRITRVDTGETVHRLQYDDPVNFVCYSPDGRYIMTDGRYWDDNTVSNLIFLEGIPTSPHCWWAFDGESFLIWDKRAKKKKRREAEKKRMETKEVQVYCVNNRELRHVPKPGDDQ